MINPYSLPWLMPVLLCLAGLAAMTALEHLLGAWQAAFGGPLRREDSENHQARAIGWSIWTLCLIGLLTLWFAFQPDFPPN